MTISSGNITYVLPSVKNMEYIIGPKSNIIFMDGKKSREFSIHWSKIPIPNSLYTKKSKIREMIIKASYLIFNSKGFIKSKRKVKVFQIPELKDAQVFDFYLKDIRSATKKIIQGRRIFIPHKGGTLRISLSSSEKNFAVFWKELSPIISNIQVTKK